MELAGQRLYLASVMGVFLLTGASFAQDASEATILQLGQGNVTTIEQSGEGNRASASLNGNANGQTIGEITQTGSGAYAEIYIEGDGNNFDVAQTGQANAFYGTAFGADNSFQVEQINAFSDAYQNYGVVLQSGSANSASLEQTVQAYDSLGGINTAIINQTGNGNTATIEQTGSENFAAVTQTGDGNEGTLLQNGVGLSAELNQIGSNLPGYTITQDCIAASCDQNIIVNQSNLGSTFVTSAAGS